MVKNPNRKIIPVCEESVNEILDTYMGKTLSDFELLELNILLLLM
jgi:bleomycin hydrolase